MDRRVGTFGLDHAKESAGQVDIIETLLHGYLHSRPPTGGQLT